jgi:hypothetical protein
MKRFAIITLVATAFFACKKKSNELIIEGRVISSVSGNGIAGTEIKLFGNGLNSGVYNPNFSSIASASSGNDGMYRLMFENPNPVQYKCKFSANNYLEKDVLLNPDEILATQPFLFDVAMLPKGLVHFQFSNEQPGSSSDLMTFQLADYGLDCACCPSSLISFSGPVINYDQICALPAERWHKYVYFTLKNGTSNTQLDSVWVSQGQTASVMIGF